MIFSPLQVKIVTLIYFEFVNQVFLVRYDVNGIFHEKVAYLWTDSNNELYCCRLPLSMCFLFKCHCNQLTWGTVAMKVSWLTAVTSNWPRLFVNRTLNDTGYCFLLLLNALPAIYSFLLSTPFQWVDETLLCFPNSM